MYNRNILTIVFQYSGPLIVWMLIVQKTRYPDENVRQQITVMLHID